MKKIYCFLFFTLILVNCNNASKNVSEDASKNKGSTLPEWFKPVYVSEMIRAKYNKIEDIAFDILFSHIGKSIVEEQNSTIEPPSPEILGSQIVLVKAKILETIIYRSKDPQRLSFVTYFSPNGYKVDFYVYQKNKYYKMEIIELFFGKIDFNDDYYYTCDLGGCCFDLIHPFNPSEIIKGKEFFLPTEDSSECKYEDKQGNLILMYRSTPGCNMNEGEEWILVLQKFYFVKNKYKDFDPKKIYEGIELKGFAPFIHLSDFHGCFKLLDKETIDITNLREEYKTEDYIGKIGISPPTMKIHNFLKIINDKITGYLTKNPIYSKYWN